MSQQTYCSVLGASLGTGVYDLSLRCNYSGAVSGLQEAEVREHVEAGLVQKVEERIVS